ncbi:MAG: polyamine aminopropyltransferase [Ramlibacter sp.]|uniref:hypothetical protein n=1 Tax=Ramlibacter sp. TaxID=1917967 RepID=UPI0026020B81|nr:hypothetical protein [Ramlibacter sp.]MDB5749730.1 polyamine aminopropyltransferase [Ramlibacter sp.]
MEIEWLRPGAFFGSILPPLFGFPRDMARVPAQVERLADQALVTTCEREWGKVQP